MLVLVVIAIISILAAMLLPALSRAKAAVYKVSCSSNLKQVYQFMAAYADENADFLPGNSWGNAPQRLMIGVLSGGYGTVDGVNMDWGGVSGTGIKTTIKAGIPSSSALRTK